jgi:glycogen operon protein
VVFNHTAEGGHDGPTLSFRGFENKTYYILEQDKHFNSNYTGCGNTINANNPIVRRMIIDSLHYWVTEMHVDGFRFDLASILTRDENGNPLENPPVLWDIESSPTLAGTKLFAEAWDAGGLYQVGSFIGDSWKEWNGRFRDDVRSFLKGERSSTARFADRLLGSPEVYGHKEREPEQSINFVTCHDGFTLNDLVSYAYKHNEANGENNHDGSDDNLSWNCGIEGPTDNPEVEKMRNRQVKNFLTITLFSMGMPMILMGDEVRRTQLGNNNVYCQDNEVSWFNWDLVDKHADILRFTKLHIERRLLRGMEHEQPRMSLNKILRQAKFSWHGVKLNQPDWSDNSHSVAFTAEIQNEGLLFHMILNAHWEPLDFELPPVKNPNDSKWRRWIDTALEMPNDIVEWKTAPIVQTTTYLANPHSVVLLFASI